MKSFMDQLASMCVLQNIHGFAITGLYLAKEQIDSVRDLLTADRPVTGAIGRLRNIPVFPLPNAQVKDPEELRTYEDITYSCVPW